MAWARAPTRLMTPVVRAAQQVSPGGPSPVLTRRSVQPGGPRQTFTAGSAVWMHGVRSKANTMTQAAAQGHRAATPLNTWQYVTRTRASSVRSAQQAGRSPLFDTRAAFKEQEQYMMVRKDSDLAHQLNTFDVAKTVSLPLMQRPRPKDSLSDDTVMMANRALETLSGRSAHPQQLNSIEAVSSSAERARMTRSASGARKRKHLGSSGSQKRLRTQ